MRKVLELFHLYSIKPIVDQDFNQSTAGSAAIKGTMAISDQTSINQLQGVTKHGDYQQILIQSRLCQ